MVKFSFFCQIWGAVSLMASFGGYLRAVVMGQNADSYPKFSYLDHPLYTLPFDTPPPTPVIMSKYFFRSHREGLKSSEYGLFAPKKATYKFLDGVSSFCEECDVLYTPSTTMSEVNEDHFATIQLTGPAKVYVVLTEVSVGSSLRDDLTSIGSNAPLGVPSNWVGEVYPIRHESDGDFQLADTGRWADALETIPYLSEYGVAVEVLLDENYELKLPHPRSLRYRGDDVENLLVLVAPIDGGGGEGDVFDGTFVPLGPHPEPAIPIDYDSFLTPGKMIQPSSDPPFPNESCPSWLHELYVVQDTGVYAGKYWSTWHAPIDPVYWCYFDHEHGGYPGHYRPKFHYTSFHTPDPSTESGRQDESHEGFKVFPFFADDGRVVVMMVHAHISNPRRFLSRHHTYLMAVFSSSWEMQMEIYMKADFGPLRAIGTGFFLESQQDIYDQIREDTGQNTERDINLLDPDNLPSNNGMHWNGEVDENHPRSPYSGRYEEWRFRMNCVSSFRLHVSGISIENTHDIALTNFLYIFCRSRTLAIFAILVSNLSSTNHKPL